MSQGSSRSTRRSIGGTSNNKTSTPSATTESTELIDMQGSVGNAAVASMVAQDSSKTSKGSVRFSPMQRATLLASTERLVLASMVYAESTASTEVTDEMRALAAVGQNRSDHMRENPDDETLFGTSDMQELVRDPFQFEEYGQSAHMVFNDAARFNAEFASEQDLQHALAAIKVAAEIEAAGNPFSDDYLVFASDDDVQHSDRLDQSTKATYGSLTFWAFAPQAARKTEEEEEVEKATGNDGGDEAA